MTQWGLDTLFNPAKRHMDEEKRRLQSTREEVGDSSGGKRIDFESGKVRIRQRPTSEEPAADATGEREPATAESPAEGARRDKGRRRAAAADPRRATPRPRDLSRSADPQPTPGSLTSQRPPVGGGSTGGFIGVGSRSGERGIHRTWHPLPSICSGERGIHRNRSTACQPCRWRASAATRTTMTLRNLFGQGKVPNYVHVIREPDHPCRSYNGHSPPTTDRYRP